MSEGNGEGGSEGAGAAAGWAASAEAESAADAAKQMLREGAPPEQGHRPWDLTRRDVLGVEGRGRALLRRVCMLYAADYLLLPMLLRPPPECADLFDVAGGV